jgi:hypothetical protein
MLPWIMPTSAICWIREAKACGGACSRELKGILLLMFFTIRKVWRDIHCRKNS